VEVADGSRASDRSGRIVLTDLDVEQDTLDVILELVV